jgi:hypothetical protein
MYYIYIYMQVYFKENANVFDALIVQKYLLNSKTVRILMYICIGIFQRDGELFRRAHRHHVSH